MTTAAPPSLVLSAPPATPPLTDADVASLRSTHGRVAVVSSKARTTRKGAEVKATLEEIGRAAKVTVIHYKQKSRYFKKNGHRQPFFKVKIDSIK